MTKACEPTPHPKIWEGKKGAKFGAVCDNFDRECLRNGSRYQTSEKQCDQARTAPSTLVEKIGEFSRLTRKLQARILTHRRTTPRAV